MIILSFQAILTLIPIIVIIILIGAAAGLSRGSNIFTFFGFGSLLGFSKGIGSGGAGKSIKNIKYSKRSNSTLKNIAEMGIIGKSGKLKLVEARKLKYAKISKISRAMHASSSSPKLRNRMLFSSMSAKTPLSSASKLHTFSKSETIINPAGGILMAVGNASLGEGLLKDVKNKKQLHSEDKYNKINDKIERTIVNAQNKKNKYAHEVEEKTFAKKQATKIKKSPSFHLKGFGYEGSGNAKAQFTVGLPLIGSPLSSLFSKKVKINRLSGKLEHLQHKQNVLYAKNLQVQNPELYKSVAKQYNIEEKNTKILKNLKQDYYKTSNQSQFNKILSNTTNSAVLVLNKSEHLLDVNNEQYQPKEEFIKSKLSQMDIPKQYIDSFDKKRSKILQASFIKKKSIDADPNIVNKLSIQQVIDNSETVLLGSILFENLLNKEDKNFKISNKDPLINAFENKDQTKIDQILISNNIKLPQQKIQNLFKSSQNTAQKIMNDASTEKSEEFAEKIMYKIHEHSQVAYNEIFKQNLKDTISENNSDLAKLVDKNINSLNSSNASDFSQQVSKISNGIGFMLFKKDLNNQALTQEAYNNLKQDINKKAPNLIKSLNNIKIDKQGLTMDKAEQLYNNSMNTINTYINKTADIAAEKSDKLFSSINTKKLFNQQSKNELNIHHVKLNYENTIIGRKLKENIKKDKEKKAIESKKQEEREFRQEQERERREKQKQEEDNSKK